MIEQAAIAGIYPMLYSFFRADGRLDAPAMGAQVDAALSVGAHGIAVGGLASEINKLDLNERHGLLEVTATALNRRRPLSVTIAEPSVAGQIAFAQAAVDHGADWVVLQPPPVRGISETALIRFFGAVADKVTVPVGVQNAPGYLGIGLSNAGLKTLHDNHPNVSVLKAEGPAVMLEHLIAETDGRFRVFNGRAGLELTDSLRAGCIGLIPGIDTIDRQVQIYQLMQAGDDTAADQAFRDLLPLISFLMEDIQHLLCYGKRLAAQRLGLAPVTDRAPAAAPTAFGETLMARLAAGLPALPRRAAGG